MLLERVPTLRLLSPWLHLLARLAVPTTFVLIASSTVANAQSAHAARHRYYVAPSPRGNDQNSCLSPKAPCATVNGAITKATDGDIIGIAAGTYAETVTITKALTLIGAGAGVTSIVGGARPLEEAIVTTMASGVTIERLAIENGANESDNRFVASGLNNTGTLALKNVLVSHNQGYDTGGISNSGVVTLTDVTISDNQRASEVSALLNTGTATLVDSMVRDNGNANTFAGTISNGGTLTVIRSTIRDNRGYAAGGIDGSATLIHSVVAGNGAFEGGGLSGDFTLIDSAVTGNYADSDTGGGIYGRVTLIRSTLSGNTAPDNGGGIYGNATLLDSTVSGNHSGGRGGGIYGGALLTNSTVSGNVANDKGGGIYSTGTFPSSEITGTGAVTAANSTIADNSAFEGGGLYVAGSIPILKDTLLVSNTAALTDPVMIGPDCYGSVMSQGYNIIGDAANCAVLPSGGEHDQVGTSDHPIDARLGLLQNNGGPTPTQALLPGSPAINAGNPRGCTDSQGRRFRTDQRGEPRPDPISGRCDIGAYEAQNPSPVGGGTTTPELDSGALFMTGLVPVGVAVLYRKRRTKRKQRS